MTHKRRRQGIGLGIFLFLALGLICGWMGVGGVENNLTDGTRAALDGRGLTDIDVDYQGRKAVLTGTAPAGTDRAELASALRTEGVRDVDISGVTVAAAAAAAVPAPAATGTVDMVAAVDGDKITLSGEVLNEAQRDELVSAANAEFGAANVTDRLTISELDPEIAGADARVSEVAGLMPQLRNNLLDGKATLAGTALAVTGLAASTDAVDAIAGPVNGLSGFDTTVDLNAPEPAASAPAVAPTEVPTPEPTPEPEPQAEEVIADLDLTGVQFEVGTAVLTADARGILDNVAFELSRFPDVNVRVEGHTDSQGGDDSNLALSQARAEAVVAYLTDTGISTERLSPVGFGETQPIADNNSDEGRAQNRRVELVIEEGN